ncbi:MAG: aldo/keto reductase [Acetobacteraceae bacterium]|nr:aldo/keto reductase [Acetobacteraceae bacterium]MDW8398019.1 aldo/keto reductase [Acetobacteraceae bacterium]
MRLRALGRSGIEIPPVVFGGNVFGWTADRATSFRLLDACLDHGLFAIDTADVYSAWAPGHRGGESETVIGEWLKSRPGARRRVLILTKCGMRMPDGEGLSPGWIARACEASLRRLGVERIDLYQAHRDDPGVPLADTLGAFGRLIAEGKVRAIGASNYSAARLAAALGLAGSGGLPRFESLQPRYNPLERAIEADLVPLCLSEQVGIIGYSALASGFLSGKYRSAADLSKSPRGERYVANYLTPRGFAVLDAVARVAARHGAAMASVAIAWQIAKPGITAPIASCTSLEQFAELLAGATLALPPEDIAEIDAAGA